MRAQQDVSFGHYWAMEPSFNPASVGKEDKLNVAVAYAMQFAGFEHNPKTMYAAGDMPFYGLGAYHGVGLQLLNDAIGLFSHKRLGVQYAYKKSLFGGRLSMGVEANILSEGFDGSKAEMPENNTDPAIATTDVTGTGIDFGAGLYYTHGPWYAGVSVLHATAPEVELGDRSILSVSRTYFLTAGYNIRLRNPFLSIHPSVLAHTDGTSHRVNVTTRLKYTHDKKMMYAGLGYSPSNSVTALIGGFFHGITIGYSYEVYTSVLKIGNGSHELFVGYQTELNFQKKGRNRHQSVRIL
jgi:type IX secretion system PorP/SprF family membrane protein